MIEDYYSLFKNFNFINKNYLIFKGILPPSILDEINLFVVESRKYKNHPLGFLKSMHNSISNDIYQCFVPFSLVNSSLFYSYLSYLANFYKTKFKNNLEELKLNKKYYLGHDTYDLWVNFSKKNSHITSHSHQGIVSGIVYVNNFEKAPTIFNKDFSYIGKPGEILLFPSNLKHEVPKQITDTERVTISFNLR